LFFLDDDEHPKFIGTHGILLLDDTEKYNMHLPIFLKAQDAQYKEKNTKKSTELIKQAL
jgi:hypothetical protein